MEQFRDIGLFYFHGCKQEMCWSWNEVQKCYNLGDLIHGMLNHFRVTSSDKGILK